MPRAFRLAPVLRLRQHVEDERARALARVLREREAAAQRLADLERRTADWRRALVATGCRGASGAVLASMADAVRSGVSAARNAAVRLTTEDARVGAARAELTSAARDRKVLERLREIQRAAARRRAEEHEQRHLDDIAGLYFNWRRAGKDAVTP